MIKIINIENAAKEDILTRDIKLESGVEAIVADIIKNVRENGDAALKEYSLKFDKAEIKNLRVTAEEIDSAYNSEDPALIEKHELGLFLNLRDDIIERPVLYFYRNLSFLRIGIRRDMQYTQY